ncbi:hypothetical protein ABEF95_004146 [Exophiala dermatitidis]
MPPSPAEGTDGSKTWKAAHLFEESDAERWPKIHQHLNQNEFRAAITTAFELPPGDSFTYHASASVSLAQVEAAIHAGRANGLHAWYIERIDDQPAGNGQLASDATSPNNDTPNPNDDRRIPGQPSLRIVGYPPPNDIQAYISLFDPTKSAANSLKSLGANAKKDSIRAFVADYLLSKRYLDKSIVVPKYKLQASTTVPPQSPNIDPSGNLNNNNNDSAAGRSSASSSTTSSAGHPNPALDFWAYACHALEFAGPNKNTALVRSAHHMLPVYMHHFGCVVPSWEALQVVAKLAHQHHKSTFASSQSGSRSGASASLAGGGSGAVLDMGSGNGYWTLMLRRLNANLDVIAVDSGQSRWRTTWIPDTVVADGIQYLRKRGGCPDRVLLLVYPIVGGEFTRKVLDAYTGGVVCVAGTQNGNGYTGFKDMMIDEYMARHRPDWEKVCQIPLPSYAGKDDALFAFRRKSDVSND